MNSVVHSLDESLRHLPKEAGWMSFLGIERSFVSVEQKRVRAIGRVLKGIVGTTCVRHLRVIAL